ncbi:hypothetical protein ROJ8625_02427 [Roseivivax jejudonensis]|uniref:VWFA domain-containing protein n=1 Tax=Roseivivax jejudonensis TaxID=1529041 RepID=A0A1X6ZF33_9RHOB|nr:hypothetical protein ROJ8625_02427 [Roseivivax jejudonensis]
MRAAALLALLLSLATAGAARAQECRLALLLALDVSSSVDAREYALQRDGLAAALNDPDIRAALLFGPGRVALSAYEWSGRQQSVVVLDWTMIASERNIDAVIAGLTRSPRSQTRFPTAMGFALGFGATHLARGPACARRVIDVSGDGVTNDGFGPGLAYQHFPFEGVTVNGLAVLGADPEVDRYYDEVVRHGPGAFVEYADGYEGFRRAMTRKLLREIGGMVVGGRARPHPEGSAG